MSTLIDKLHSEAPPGLAMTLVAIVSFGGAALIVLALAN